MQTIGITRPRPGRLETMLHGLFTVLRGLQVSVSWARAMSLRH